MLFAERMELILQQLQLQSTVKVRELSQLLNVSVDTIRRDLKAMEQQGLIKYIHGGACLPDTMAVVSNFTGREIVNIDKKREACRKALSYIQEGMVIALNSGTTNTILAQELITLDKEFTVVTNNYAAVNILMQKPSIHLVAIGGEVDPMEKSSCGLTCEREFAKYFPDIAFLSINALNYRDAFTDFRLHETGIIELLAGNAKQVIAIMDSSKLGKRSKKTVLDRDKVDFVLMDDHITEEIRQKYQDKGIEIR